jgi:hypothetical protein
VAKVSDSVVGTGKFEDRKQVSPVSWRLGTAKRRQGECPALPPMRFRGLRVFQNSSEFLPNSFDRHFYLFVGSSELPCRYIKAIFGVYRGLPKALFQHKLLMDIGFQSCETRH